MTNGSGTNSLRFEGKGLDKFMGNSLKKMSSDKKENLHQCLLKNKDNFTINNLFSED